MRKVRDNSAVPRGGEFVYIHEDGYRQTHSYYEQLKEQVKNYKRTNSLPIGLAFDDEFDENLCAHADPSTCEDFIPPTLLQKMSTLAQALYKAARGGFKIVSVEKFEARRTICGSCNYFDGTSGLLKVACKRCGCAGVKLYLQSETCPINKWA